MIMTPHGRALQITQYGREIGTSVCGVMTTQCGVRRIEPNACYPFTGENPDRSSWMQKPSQLVSRVAWLAPARQEARAAQFI